jgi:hydrogenase expression/formation protein HypD
MHSAAKKLPHPIRLMEVCGTHTVAMFHHGIRKILPENISVISGPGCPVCVTSQADIDRAVAFTGLPGTIITTFGDMLKVPGTQASLGEMRAQGKDVRVVYSVLDALEIAKKNPAKKIVHIAIGFETTAPTVAAVIFRAKSEKVSNFLILSAHKIVPPALNVLASSAQSRINAFLLPGHVSAIIGIQPYQFLARRFKIPCVVAGFEAVDILQAIVMLERQIIAGKPAVEIQYARCVHKTGNKTAQGMLAKVFKVCDTQWRGLGMMKNSGLALRREFSGFDALRYFKIEIPYQKPTPCRCGDVLQGIIAPPECPLFKKKCTPQNPVGPCMVSTEGSCAAFYRYGGNRG